MFYVGTIMEISDNKAYIFTADCGMVSIKSKEEYFVGQQIKFSKDEVKRNNFFTRSKAMMSIAAVAALAIVAIPVYAILRNNSASELDKTCTAVVSVDINPGIEISINKDDLIVGVKSTNDDGKKLLEEVSIEEKSIKDGFEDVLNKAEEMGYISAEQKVVLISAAINERDKIDNPESYTEDLKNVLTLLSQSSENANILTVFISNDQILDDAQQNGLSIGKELLYRYAKLNNKDITLEEIESSSITAILEKLNAIDSDGKITDDFKIFTENTEKYTTTSTTTAVTENTTAPETDQTTVITDEITVTTPATEAPVEDGYKLSVSSSNGKLKFSWDALDSSSVNYKGSNYSNFYYYKVVASATDSTPVYPDNGYLYYTSDKNSSNVTIDPESGDYNKNPELIPGKYYYFSITYVFENGKFTSNTVKYKVPGSAAVTTIPTETQQPQLSITQSNGTLKFSWTALNSSSVSYNGSDYNNFYYYKVVASATDSTPIYPDNGYLYYCSDIGSSSWSLNPSSGDYNKNPELIPGKTYYFSITYVFENGKFTSNTVKYKVSGSAAVTTTPAATQQPHLTVTQSNGTLKFSWTALQSSSIVYNGTEYSDFNYYKVVASETNPTPIYPDDGYLYYTTDLNASSWTLNPSTDDYNQNPEIVSGKTYYFTITYVFGSGKFITNSVKVTVQ